MAVFSGDKYKKASSDALAFIKRQLDVNNFKCQITFDKEYDDSYSVSITCLSDSLRLSISAMSATSSRKPLNVGVSSFCRQFSS